MPLILKTVAFGQQIKLKQNVLVFVALYVICWRVGLVLFKDTWSQ